MVAEGTSISYRRRCPCHHRLITSQSGSLRRSLSFQDSHSAWISKTFKTYLGVSKGLERESNSQEDSKHPLRIEVAIALNALSIERKMMHFYMVILLR